MVAGGDWRWLKTEQKQEGNEKQYDQEALSTRISRRPEKQVRPGGSAPPGVFFAVMRLGATTFCKFPDKKLQNAAKHIANWKPIPYNFEGWTRQPCPNMKGARPDVPETSVIRSNRLPAR